MKNLPLLFLAFLMTACQSSSPYGAKVKINSKSEVYYQPPGITEKQARDLGNFLLRSNYFDDQRAKSVQMLSSADTVVVKFVVDPEKLKDNNQYEIGFLALKILMTDSVFMGKPVRVVLANDRLEDIRAID